MNHPKPPRTALLSSADDVEAQFYEALQQADLARLMAVWADDDEIVCVHPGGARLVGGAAIRASFEAIFANGGVAAQPEEVHRLQGLGVSVHHLIERVQLAGPSGAQARQAWVQATNVYMQTAQGWRLVAHHASPATQEAPPPQPRERPSTLH